MSDTLVGHCFRRSTDVRGPIYEELVGVALCTGLPGRRALADMPSAAASLWRSSPSRRKMTCMDAAEYDRIAQELGAPPEEALYALACARYDLRRHPETAHGRDACQIAADALTAVRAFPARPPLPEVQFRYHAWAPGHVQTSGPTAADEFMEWWQVATARRRQTAQ